MKVTTDSFLGADDMAWPPGFRFHPTDEELVVYYLKRKICKKRLKLNIVREVDVYKWDPEELPGQSILKTGDRQWFFFSPRDRKYPNGARSNRATRQGYWKATGKDRIVVCNSRNVGLKKTLVFYRGRAPNGDRTDWVMHEYTMDEEELKRCPNVQDYYALYKVYKKSGAGPKNGEQYGAPFKEEDWVDDEFPRVNGLVTPEIPVKQHIEATLVDNFKLSAPLELPLNDFEEIIKQIGGEHAFNGLQNNDFSCLLPQVNGEEEAQSTLVDPCFREFVCEPVGELTTSDQHCNKHTNFNFDQSDTSTLRLHEAPEVTSATHYEQAPQLNEGDFLEINDLIDPEPSLSNAEQPVENLQFDDFDGLSEFELYHDAAMFLRDLGPVDQEAVSHSFMHPYGCDMVNQVGYQSQPDSIINAVDYQLQQSNLVASQVDCDLQPQFFDAEQMNNHLWVHGQRSNMSAASESHNGIFFQSPPGDVCESSNNSTIANENQGVKEGDAANGWLSSALWDFVESIPTTPASASENPLVNKAFERMSSFSRIRMNVKSINVEAASRIRMNVSSINVAAANGAASVRSAGRTKGFVLLSIVGVLCAILWVFLGSGRLSGR
ncbi:no apical meristem family protein [Salix suchowensis]|nr:no apical meristem family protein [Salix suchowensis]